MSVKIITFQFKLVIWWKIPECRTSNPIPEQYFLSVTGHLMARFHVFGSQGDKRVSGLSVVLQDFVFNLFYAFKPHLI